MSHVYHNSFYAMGTRCHLVLPDMEQGRGERVFQVVKQEINRVEASLSRFIPYSDISVINKNAGKKPVTVSEELFKILKSCLDFYELTEGAFDITLRPLVQYWKNKASNSDSDLHMYELMDDLGARHIVLNEDEHTVFLKNENIEIDLGGFGKGYGLKTVQKLFHEFDVKDAFISFGESSILTLGSHPAGDHWKIGLNDYTSPGQSVYTFSLNEGSVSTSSNFYVDDNGKLHNHRHVINPFTGYPVEEIITVSVRAESPVTAEVLSTAFLVLSDEVIDTIRASVSEECEIVKVNYDSGRPEVHIIEKQQIT